jgi:hypothetical protein
MTARTVVEALSGAKLYITAGIPATYDQAGYESTDVTPTWTEITEVENFGNHGGSATITEFTPVATATVAKVKGSKNYGKMTCMCGYKPGDAGQVIVRAAFESTAHYSVKVDYQDGEVHYLDVLISKAENQDGAVNDVQKLGFDMDLCRAPVIVLP